MLRKTVSFLATAAFALCFLAFICVTAKWIYSFSLTICIVFTLSGLVILTNLCGIFQFDDPGKHIKMEVFFNIAALTFLGCSLLFSVGPFVHTNGYIATIALICYIAACIVSMNKVVNDAYKAGLKKGSEIVRENDHIL